MFPKLNFIIFNATKFFVENNTKKSISISKIKLLPTIYEFENVETLKSILLISKEAHTCSTPRILCMNMCVCVWKNTLK